MASRVISTWNGDKVIARVHEAAVEAVNETVDEAAADAALSHEWVDRPTRWSPSGGQLESQIKSEHADPVAANPTARFGTTRRKGFVGLFHEEGTVEEYARPFLRPAADRNFPSLPGKIRRRLGPE